MILRVRGSGQLGGIQLCGCVDVVAADAITGRHGMHASRIDIDRVEKRLARLRLVAIGVPRRKEALVDLAGWIASGDLKYREDVIEGFENMPKALIGLFLGENIGKRVVRVA